jgi:hypothetical protein
MLRFHRARGAERRCASGEAIRQRRLP